RELYTLSLRGALPIFARGVRLRVVDAHGVRALVVAVAPDRPLRGGERGVGVDAVARCVVVAQRDGDAVQRIGGEIGAATGAVAEDRKSTRLNSSHVKN